MVIPVRRRLGGCRRLNSNLPTTVLTTRECRTLTYDGCEEWITSYLHCCRRAETGRERTETREGQRVDDEDDHAP